MKDIIVFGRGNYYRAKESSIKKIGRIQVFLDNSVEQGLEEVEDGIKVINPNDYIFDNKSNVVIAISVGVVKVVNQLLQLGVAPRSIILCYSMKPEFDLFDRVFKDEIEINVNTNGVLMGKEQQLIYNDDEFKMYVRKHMETSNSAIGIIKKLPSEPISRRFGLEMGTSVTRRYVDDFIDLYKNDIQGNTIEVAELRYSKKYNNKIKKASVMHVYGWNSSLQIDLETGAGVEANCYDSFICTQTIQMIYGIKNAVNNIYKMLKKGGVALVTISALSQLSLSDCANWGEYWRVTEESCKKLFGEFFERDKIEICSYGNPKMACALLYGINVESFEKEDIEFQDKQYPILIGIRAKK